MISSTHNPLVQQIVSLRKKSERETQKLMIIEGTRELRFAQQNSYPLQAVIYCPDLLNEDGKKLISDCQAGQCIEVTKNVFEKIAYRENPDGILALAPLMTPTLDQLELSACPLLIVAEQAEKPGNVGAILRIADAAGADAVVLTDPLTDLGNPNVSRSSQGTLFSVPSALATNEETLKFLRAHSIQIVGTTAHADKAYTDLDLTQPTAFLVGNEHTGLSGFWKSNGDLLTTIPMAGQASSLNLSSATSILVFEAVRQRNQR